MNTSGDFYMTLGISRFSHFTYDKYAVQERCIMRNGGYVMGWRRTRREDLDAAEIRAVAGDKADRLPDPPVTDQDRRLPVDPPTVTSDPTPGDVGGNGDGGGWF
jgi:hypothetical protein